MRIFISYGHNDHLTLVNRIFDRLMAAGHEPWKDDRYEGASGIPAGADFTQVIYDAIDASDFMIAIVSSATIEKPYCCDERQYGYNAKGTKFIQIRLDGAPIRLGNSRSYIDMDDAENSDGTLNEEVFNGKLQSLFAALRDPESFAADANSHWAKFETHLKVPGVMKYHEFVALLDKEDYVGREWLCKKCRDWAMDSSISCRLFVILGEAGTGKTTFIRNLVADRSLVRSVHVCIYDKPSTRTAKETLKDIAYILSQNNESYFNFLKNKNLEKISEMSIDALFEFLFIEPLKGETEKYLLVIDGLDELDEVTGFNPLMQVFRQYAEKLNPCVSFLVTGRPDENIVNKLQTVSARAPLNSVVLDKESGREDLKQYIVLKLTELGCYTDTLRDKLLEACDGNFEFLSLLFKEAQEEGLEISENINIPKGLDRRYTQYLDRRMEMAGLSSRFTKLQRTILSVLCAAYEPLSLTLLAEILGEDEFDILEEIGVFGSLIRQRKDENRDIIISLFTKGFRDFLVEKCVVSYSADLNAGTKVIAKYTMDNFKRMSAFAREGYIDRNGVAHILKYANKLPEETADYILSLMDGDKDPLILKIASSLAKGDRDVIRAYCNLKDVIDEEGTVIKRLKGSREVETLFEIAETFINNGNVAYGLLVRGDAYRFDAKVENVIKAQNDYAEACKIEEERYEATPDFKVRRRLSTLYERRGILAKRGSTPEAKAESYSWYNKALALDEQNYKEYPSYETRRDLSYSCMNLGILTNSEKTKEGYAKAKELYERSIMLREENYKYKPCYESRYDLERAYGKMGDYFSMFGDFRSRAKAFEYFMKSYELALQNYKDNPCYESLRSLSVSCDRLGDIEEEKGTAEGYMESEKWRLQELEYDRKNYAENPCFISRRGLALTYENLGHLFLKKHSPEASEKAREYFIESAELLEINCIDNPCYESYNAVIHLYKILILLAEKKKGAEGLEEVAFWQGRKAEKQRLIFEENPTSKTAKEYVLTLSVLGRIAASFLTPEKDAIATEWYLKKVEVEKKMLEIEPARGVSELKLTYSELEKLARRRNTPEGDAEAKNYVIKQLKLITDGRKALSNI